MTNCTIFFQQFRRGWKLRPFHPPLWKAKGFKLKKYMSCSRIDVSIQLDKVWHIHFSVAQLYYNLWTIICYEIDTVASKIAACSIAGQVYAVLSHNVTLNNEDKRYIWCNPTAEDSLSSFSVLLQTIQSMINTILRCRCQETKTKIY